MGPVRQGWIQGVFIRGGPQRKGTMAGADSLQGVGGDRGWDSSTGGGIRWGQPCWVWHHSEDWLALQGLVRQEWTQGVGAVMTGVDPRGWGLVRQGWNQVGVRRGQPCWMWRHSGNWPSLQAGAEGVSHEPNHSGEDCENVRGYY